MLKPITALGESARCIRLAYLYRLAWDSDLSRSPVVLHHVKTECLHIGANRIAATMPAESRTNVNTVITHNPCAPSGFGV